MNKVFLFIFFLSFTSTYAQVKDAAVWAGFEAEKNITQKFAIQVSENIRFVENITEIGTAFSEVGLDYKLMKSIKLGATYRFSQKKQVDDFYSIRHRYALHFSYKLKVKKINFTIRIQYQSGYKDMYTSENGLTPTNYLRRKLSLKYDLEKKYTPFISCELWQQLNNAEENGINNIRYQLGIDYELNKFHSFTLSYIIDKELNRNNPWTNYITNIGYKYSF